MDAEAEPLQCMDCKSMEGCSIPTSPTRCRACWRIFDHSSSPAQQLSISSDEEDVIPGIAHEPSGGPSSLAYTAASYHQEHEQEQEQDWEQEQEQDASCFDNSDDNYEDYEICAVYLNDYVPGERPAGIPTCDQFVFLYNKNDVHPRTTYGEHYYRRDATGHYDVTSSDVWRRFYLHDHLGNIHMGEFGPLFPFRIFDVDTLTFPLFFSEEATEGITPIHARDQCYKCNLKPRWRTQEESDGFFIPGQWIHACECGLKMPPTPNSSRLADRTYGSECFRYRVVPVSLDHARF